MNLFMSFLECVYDCGRLFTRCRQNQLFLTCISRLESPSFYPFLLEPDRYWIFGADTDIGELKHSDLDILARILFFNTKYKQEHMFFYAHIKFRPQSKQSPHHILKSQESPCLLLKHKEIQLSFPPPCKVTLACSWACNTLNYAGNCKAFELPLHIKQAWSDIVENMPFIDLCIYLCVRVCIRLYGLFCVCEKYWGGLSTLVFGQCFNRRNSLCCTLSTISKVEPHGLRLHMSKGLASAAKNVKHSPVDDK